MYRMDWDNIKQIYYQGRWMNVDSLRDSVGSSIAKIKADIIDSLSKNTFYTPYDVYLEKAGNNLVAGAVLPIAGTLIGGGLIALSKNDNGGSLTAGYLIVGGTYLAAFICNLSAGNNLIKAQRYLDYTKQPKGLTLGVQPTGVGIGYRF